MKTELEAAIKVLAKKSTDTATAIEAMQLAQAVLNLTQARMNVIVR